jgi:acyl-CoA dehydrogenase
VATGLFINNMEFVLSLVTDAQRELQARVEALCRGSLGDLDRAAGETDVVDRRILASLAHEGLLDWALPGDDGSRRSEPAAPQRMSLVAFCLVRETLARYCPNAELIFTMQGLGAGPISFFGTEDQRRRYLPRVASGELVAAFALTEPHTGSDPAALKVTAVRDADAYVLNGTKTFISMAPDADLYTVFAKTDPNGGNRGISCFIVEKGTPGFDPGRRLSLLAPHPIGEPVFTNCRVPAENRVGDENAGFKVAMGSLDFFRTTVGACAVGFAQRALDESIHYARERKAFGKSISEFQLVQMKLAAMATDLAAARLLVYRAALTRDSGRKPRVTLESAQAKLYATEAAQRIIDEAVQIHGGYGVMKGFEVERLYREIRALRIYEGTSEIQHLVIASQLLRDPS